MNTEKDWKAYVKWCERMKFTPPTKCSLNGCWEPMWARDFCHGHYTFWYRNGGQGIVHRELVRYLDKLIASPIPPEKQCKRFGCKRRAVSRQLCERHYQQAYDRGDFAGDKQKPWATVKRYKVKKAIIHCSTDGCRNQAVAKGLCYKHNAQMHRDLRKSASKSATGDTNAVASD